MRKPRLKLLVFSSKHLGPRLAGMGVKDASRIGPAADLAGWAFAITLRDELAASIPRHRRGLRRTLTFFVRHRLQATVVSGPLERGASGGCTCGRGPHCLDRISLHRVLDMGVDDAAMSPIQPVWASTCE